MNPNNTYINRDLSKLIIKNLNKGKVIILYGSRQVGKTTLLKNIFTDKKSVLYLSCEQTRIKKQFIPDSLVLHQIIGNYKNIILDEAQYLENPGLILKVLIDNFPQRNFLASGSSAFDLANKLTEPLTGRHLKYQLFPITVSEIKKNFLSTDAGYHVEQSQIFGSYPEIFKFPTNEEKIQYLQLLTDSYLYKDIFAFNLVKDSRKIRELLIALALQIGNEVSYNELANTLSLDKKTIEKHIDLLEKSFVIFRLYGFSRNLRTEINRKIKIYFYDLGVRNALINNFNPLNLRADSGGIFENYVIAEKMKQEANQYQKANFYFWRTYNQKELDLIMEKNAKITAFEIKLKQTRKKQPFHSFKKIYPKTVFKIITQTNLLEEIQ